MSEWDEGGWDLTGSPDMENLTGPFSPDDILLPGSIIDDRYEIVDILGEGGFGVVYRARQRDMGREVALKTLRRSIAGYEEAAQRFRREARLARLLTHPHTIRLYDFGQTSSGVLYISMELLKGETLEERIESKGPIPLDSCMAIGEQIAKSLTEAHENGIVHRDLKPSNVFVCEMGKEDFVKVLDFGIAKVSQAWGDDGFTDKLTRTGTAFGSPAYMSPEQVRGSGVTSASDIYAFGLIILEALTGAQVVDGNSPFDVAVKQASPEPIPIPPWIEQSPAGWILKKCLAKRIENRYQNAAELLSDLEKISIEELREYTNRLSQNIKLDDINNPANRIRYDPEPTERISAEDLDRLQPRSRGVVLYSAVIVALVFGIVATTLILTHGQPPTPEAEAVDGAKDEVPPPPDHARLLGIQATSSIMGAVSKQHFPRSPLGIDASQLPLPLLPRSSPGTPAIVLYNVYKAISAAPIILPMSQKSTVITTHPLGLPLTKGAMMASFFGITALPRVTLKFESKPSGVQVYRQGDPNPIGRSPLEFEVVKSDQMATYRFEARGYRSVSMEVSHAAAYNGFVYMQKRKKTRNNMTVPD